VCRERPACAVTAITTDNPLNVEKAGEHLHAADPDYIQARQVATEITEASKEDPGKGLRR